MKKYIVCIKNDYCISGLKDYGFKYDEEKKIYKLTGLVIDSQTREVYCASKCSNDELAILLQLYAYNIVEYKMISKAKTTTNE